MAEEGPKGLFLPTTFILDSAELQKTEVTSDRFKELIGTMSRTLNSIVLAVNKKVTGMYDTHEFITGKTFFPDPDVDPTTDNQSIYRPGYRKVVNFGALPNSAATKTVPHGITVTPNTVFTHIYGTATDPVALRAIPLVGDSVFVGWTNTSLGIDATNVVVKTSGSFGSYTQTIIVIEYIK